MYKASRVSTQLMVPVYDPEGQVLHPWDPCAMALGLCLLRAERAGSGLGPEGVPVPTPAAYNPPPSPLLYPCYWSQSLPPPTLPRADTAISSAFHSSVMLSGSSSQASQVVLAEPTLAHLFPATHPRLQPSARTDSFHSKAFAQTSLCLKVPTCLPEPGSCLLTLCASNHRSWLPLPKALLISQAQLPPSLASQPLGSLHPIPGQAASGTVTAPCSTEPESHEKERCHGRGCSWHCQPHFHDATLPRPRSDPSGRPSTYGYRFHLMLQLCPEDNQTAFTPGGKPRTPPNSPSRPCLHLSRSLVTRVRVRSSNPGPATSWQRTCSRIYVPTDHLSSLVTAKQLWATCLGLKVPQFYINHVALGKLLTWPQFPINKQDVFSC